MILAPAKQGSTNERRVSGVIWTNESVPHWPKGCCDYVYLTWDVCDYNGAYSVRLGGSSLSTTVYYSPPRVNNVNVYFYTDHSVTLPSVSTSTHFLTFPDFCFRGFYLKYEVYYY